MYTIWIAPTQPLVALCYPPLRKLGVSMEEERKAFPNRRIVAFNGGYAVFGATPTDGKPLEFASKTDVERTATMVGAIWEKDRE